MNNIWKTTAASVFIAAGITANAASAASISLNGTDYEMDMMGGSFLDNQAVLEAQVWWGDEDLALDFASAWGASPELLVGSSSPLFAFSMPSTIIFAAQYLTALDTSDTFVVPQTSANTPFAIVTSITPTPPTVSAVPLPASSLLLLAGLGGLMTLRKRKA